VPGATETDATGVGTLTTLMLEVALTPSLVAAMTADPCDFPVTTPRADTDATVVSELAQDMDRPVRTLPFASRGVATNGSVSPIVTEALPGETVSEAIGAGRTLTVAVPVCAAVDAVIDAFPTALAVTVPLASTAATSVSVLAHDTCSPPTGCPD